MSSYVRLFMAVLAIFIGFSAVGSTSLVMEEGEIAIIGTEAKQLQLVVEGLARFERAGLALPPVVVTFDRSGRWCRRQAGYYDPADASDEPDEIFICQEQSWVVLHELAHAWEHRSLSDRQRTEMLRQWGLDHWNDPEDEWGKRGIELAAQSIAYVLDDGTPTHTWPIETLSCSYQMLTGQAPDTGSVGVECEKSFALRDGQAPPARTLTIAERRRRIIAERLLSW